MIWNDFLLICADSSVFKWYISLRPNQIPLRCIKKKKVAVLTGSSLIANVMVPRASDFEVPVLAPEMVPNTLTQFLNHFSFRFLSCLLLSAQSLLLGGGQRHRGRSQISSANT